MPPSHHGGGGEEHGGVAGSGEGTEPCEPGQARRESPESVAAHVQHHQSGHEVHLERQASRQPIASEGEAGEGRQPVAHLVGKETRQPVGFATLGCGSEGAERGLQSGEMLYPSAEEEERGELNETPDVGVHP